MNNAMSASQDITEPMSITRTRHHCDAAGASSDSDRTEKGADTDTDTVKGDDAVDTESDTTTTPDSSPPSSRHASLSSEDAKPNVTLGSFDKDGNWVWTQAPSGSDDHGASVAMKPSVTGQHDRARVAETNTEGDTKTDDSAQACDSADTFKTTVDRHEITPTTQWGPPKRIGRVRIAKAIITETGEDDFIWVDGDDWYHDYNPRPSTSRGPPPAAPVEEARTLVIPVRIRVEDDTSSDEGEASDSEARQRANSSTKVTIPKRKASVKRGGRRSTKPAT